MTQSFADPGIPLNGGGGNSTRTANVDLTANVAGYTTQMGNAAQSTGMLTRNVDELTSRIGGLNKWAGKKLFHFAAADFAALAGATVDAATFEKQLSTLAATAAVTGVSLKSIKGGIESSFTKFPVARGEVTALAESISNLGVTAPAAINSLTKTFIKMGAATGEPMTQLASGMIQLSRLMGTTDATQIGNFSNSLLTVSKNAGVSATQVVQFAQTIAPFARQAGIGQGAIQGISTAFTKAGADGFVATNAFNTIMSDITSSAATGGPQLAKYANLIGKTTTEFKKMDPTNAFVQIFNQIGKQGPQAIALLENLGISGVRAQSAIASITQSGDLQKYVGQAMASQGDQGNLTKGSQAAFNNLADSMVGLRNQFTRFGSEIGQTFLGPMTSVVHVTTSAVNALHAMVGPFAPIIAGLGVIGGTMSGIGSIALSAAGTVGAWALLRNIRTGKGMTALRGGMTVGTAREDLKAGGAIDRFTGDKMSAYERAMFMAGTAGRGGLTRVGFDPSGKGSPWRDPQVWRNALVAGPMSLMRMYQGANEKFYNNQLGERVPNGLSWAQRMNVWGAGLQGKTMVDAARGEVRPLAAQTGRTVNAMSGVALGLGGRMARMAWQFAGPMVMGSLVGGATGLPGGSTAANAVIGRLPTGSVGVEAAAVKEAAGNLKMALGGIRSDVVPLRVGFGLANRAAKELAVALTRTAGTAAGWAVGKTVSTVGSLVGSTVAGVGGAIGAVLRTAFSLPGVIALTTGRAALSHYDKENSQAASLGRYLNPIQKYNDALGTTTSNLADFNATIQASTSSLNKAPMSMKSASLFSAADSGKTPRKATNAVWGAALASGNPTETALAVLQSMPLANAQQLKAAEMDMSASGFSRTQINQVTSKYMAQGGPDAVSGLGKGGGRTGMATQGRAVVRLNQADGSALDMTKGQTRGAGTLAGLGGGAAAGAVIAGPPGAILGGIFGGVAGFFGGGEVAKHVHVNPSPGGQALNATMISGIDSQRKSDEDTKGGAFAAQNAFLSYMTGLMPEVQAIGKGGTQGERMQSAVATAMDQITGGGRGGYASSLKKVGGKLDTPEGQWSAMVKTFQATKEGRKFLGSITASGGDISSYAGGEKALINLSNTTDGSDFGARLRSSGALGQFAAKNKVVQSSLGIQQSDVGIQDTTTHLLVDQAEKQAAASGLVTDGLQGAADALSLFTAKVGDSSGALGQRITAAMQIEDTKQANLQPFQTRGVNFTQTVQAYRSASSAVEAAKASGESSGSIAELVGEREKKKQDYDSALADQQNFLIQMYQTAQAYGVQNKRAAEDEATQVQWTWDEFHRQQKWSNEDYLRERNDSWADHDRQLANAVKTTAQTIYNPFSRVQAEFTSDSGTVLQNLIDQNERLVTQRANVDKLHKAGLSTQAIQTMDLINPTNAQQTQNIVDTIDPATIAKMNAEVAKRLKDTKVVTQSPFNLAFTQSEKEFHVGLDRSARNYGIAVDRAEKQNDTALSHMKTSFDRTIKRSGEDLTTAMTQVTGNFGTMWDKTMNQIATSVEKYSPAAARQMRIDIKSITDANPWMLAGGAATNYDPSKRITTPNTIGVNPKGVLGQYDNRGTFHAGGVGPLDLSKVPAIGPPTNPITQGPFGVNPKGVVGYYTSDKKFHASPASMQKMDKRYLEHIYPPRALGGIATAAQRATFGEAGPEALIPLNERGQAFMAGLIARALGQAITMVAGGGSGSHSTSVDSSTRFTGAITVVAQNTAAFERELKAKARLSKLSSPVRH